MTAKKCSASERAGRLAKARQFLGAAELIETAAETADLPADRKMASRAAARLVRAALAV